MRWIEVADDAYGVVAIGRRATGLVAIGQVAWGGLAIGQAAFGVIAVGPLAVGGLSVGVVGLGLHATVALFGASARPLWGAVVPLLPALDLRSPSVAVSSLEAVREAGTGWVRLGLGRQGSDPVLLAEGARLEDIRLDARLRRVAAGAAPAHVLAHVRRGPGGLVVDRLAQVSTPRALQARWWLVWGLQLMGLLWLAAVVWVYAVEPALP